MTLREWLDKHEDALLAILFRGFVTKEADAAMLYRQMHLDRQKVRQLLTAAFNDTQAPGPVTQVRKNP